MDVLDAAGAVDVCLMWSFDACIVHQNINVADLFLNLLCGCGDGGGVRNIALDCCYSLVIDLGRSILERLQTATEEVDFLG